MQIYCSFCIQQEKSRFAARKAFLLHPIARKRKALLAFIGGDRAEARKHLMTGALVDDAATLIIVAKFL